MLECVGKTTAATRHPATNAYPVVDLFAGPGGLGEGFSSSVDCHGQQRFHSVAAIERDEHAHQTLLLRHFVRHFPNGEVPDEYYDFLAGRITQQELFSRYSAAHYNAQRSVLKISLGPASHVKIRKIVDERLKGNELWALVGGPPCQAYSLAGRSRMMGRLDFEKDERHLLYLEYLRIISDHEPPIFVMENVKGLLRASNTVRVRPPEVVGAANMNENDWPIDFGTADQIAHQVSPI